jgi:glycine/D-amino acid oxidase-like deaminating enzyme
MICTKQVILATNGYTSYLLPEFASFIIPVRGQMSALLPPTVLSPDDGRPLSGINSYCFYGRGNGTGSSFNQDDYLIQRPFSNIKTKGSGGELMFGGGRQHADDFGRGVSDDSDIDRRSASYLRRELIKTLDLPKDEAELCASFEWSGIMGFSKDNRPWVGQVPATLGGGEGLWICAGFTGHGMPNACLCAKKIVDMMLEKRIEDVKFPLEFEISMKRIEMANILVDSPIPSGILNY